MIGELIVRQLVGLDGASVAERHYLFNPAIGTRLAIRSEGHENA
jgi:hypothetical protein